MDYTDEAIVAMMRFHPEMEGHGWCSACRTFIEPRVDGKARARCPRCGRPAFGTLEAAHAADRPDDPDSWPGQVVRKHIDDPEDEGDPESVR